MMSKGEAYIFLRNDGAPLPGGPAGHVGWGIKLEDGSYFGGSTENSTGFPFVPPQGDNEGWAFPFPDVQAMVAEFTRRDYDSYKFATVREPKPKPAAEVGVKAIGMGYAGLFNNCLDHSHGVLKAYGVQGLPWPATNPLPHHWFNAWNAEYRNL
jgi:hypothetical protein